jgi:hypothetical protein
VRLIVFAVACIEGYAFKADLDIFNQLGAKEDVPEVLGVILAAIVMTFFSKQLHDFTAFAKAWGNRKLNPPTPPNEFNTMHG